MILRVNGKFLLILKNVTIYLVVGVLMKIKITKYLEIMALRHGGTEDLLLTL